MSNNKQSSVEWLINEHFGGIERCTPDFRAKIEQAKVLHKEEIMNAIKYGYKRDSYTPNFREQKELFEQYYKQKFGGNNEQ